MQLIKGVIFDLFGTLIKVESLFLGIAGEIATQTGNEVHEIEKKIHTLYNKHFLNYHLKEFQPERHYYQKVFKELKSEYKLAYSADWYVDYAYDTFSELRQHNDVNFLNDLKQSNFKIAILTNADSFFVRNCIEKNAIAFDKLIISEEVRAYKPSGQIFQIALDEVKLKKEEVVFVGDNINVDVLGGNNFGIKTILIDRDDSKECYPKVTNLYQIAEFIR